MSASDPLRRLQHAARLAAEHVAPGERARRVVVFDARGVDHDVTVPACLPSMPEESPASVSAWVVTDRTATFDRRAVAVGSSRLELLKVLVDAVEPLSGKELARLALGSPNDEENARDHITALRGELKVAFPDFEGDILPGEGGYRLVLR